MHINEEKIAMPEFKALWSKINSKSFYVVDFDTDELIKKSIDALDSKLRVSKIYFKVTIGEMEQINSREELENGASFVQSKSTIYSVNSIASSNVKYDLIGKMAGETGLTRKTFVKILQGIKSYTFNQFKDNPGEFIIKATSLIND